MELITDPDIIGGYLCDASNLRGCAEALLRPGSAQEVAEVLRHCQAHGIPLTVTAQRTSTVGGPVPEGGWLLSTERLQRVAGIDERHAEAEAGLLLGELQTAVEATGRLYPPDPTSRQECSLGGSIACNASGARSFRFGPTRSWVEAAQVVLADGSILEADRHTPLPAGWRAPSFRPPAVKHAAGYVFQDPRAPAAPNLLDLLIGSEGTLGVVTRARLRLCELPSTVMGLMAFFSQEEACLDFVERVRARGRRGDELVNPWCLEFFDRASLDLVRPLVPSIPAAAAAAIYLEQPHEGPPPLDAWWAELRHEGALPDDTLFTGDEGGRRAMHAARHGVPAAVNEQVVKNGMPKLSTDFAVPDAGFRELFAAYREVELPTVAFGHIGDNHLHVNLLPRDAGELARAREIYLGLARLAVRLGGTLSAEHGIGKRKRSYLPLLVPPDVLQAWRILKRQADPGWVLGRGILLEPPA